MKVEVQDVRELVMALPHKERMALLIMAAIENRQDALPVVAAVVRLAAIMAKGMSLENRYAIAERMRTAADGIERLKQPVIEWVK
jgi:hypothetical protein